MLSLNIQYLKMIFSLYLSTQSQTKFHQSFLWLLGVCVCIKGQNYSNSDESEERKEL